MEEMNFDARVACRPEEIAHGLVHDVLFGHRVPVIPGKAVVDKIYASSVRTNSE